MPKRSHRRRIVLFLVAIVVPSLVLVVLSLRMISQERELTEKRLLDEQHQRASEIRQELLTLLERIKLKQVRAMATQTNRITTVDYRDPELVFVGFVENNQLVLPWEQNPTADEFQQLLVEPAFARRIQRGEQEELAASQFGRAAASYREAMRLARKPAQATYAQLLLARSLAKSGQQSEANLHYKEILALPSELVDEQGVPFSLYAAGRLLEAGIEHQAVLECIRAELNTKRWMPPTESYILRELINKLAEAAPDNPVREAAKQMQQQISRRIRELEQAAALQKDFPNLKLAPVTSNPSGASEPLWVPYGEDTWLVSLATELAGARSAVIAVRADSILAALRADVRANDSTGSAPGNKHFDADGDGNRLERELADSTQLESRSGSGLPNPGAPGLWPCKAHFWCDTPRLKWPTPMRRGFASGERRRSRLRDAPGRHRFRCHSRTLTTADLM